MDSLENDKNSIRRLDALEMIELLKKLPTGWSMIETKNGFAICDEDDECMFEAENHEELRKLIETEFKIAQSFASFMYVLKTSKVAEA